MKNAIYLIALIFLVTFCTSNRKPEQPGESTQKGPYTVTLLAKGVYNIKDGNDKNPCGIHMDENGRGTGMNNCSDMYLVLGKDKALLIDLSNSAQRIKWDTTATESLLAIVDERIGKRDLIITITHTHGDHTGMLPAFKDNPDVSFWIPGEEFNRANIFPEGRTKFFAENESIDLGGGIIINTCEVSGHTAHGTLFFLKDKNILFSGDALGSGNGVWLFNAEAFQSYIKGINNLISYIENPANNIDTEKLVICGGHSWQVGDLGKLTGQYIYDMRTLIEKIGEGTATIEPSTSRMGFLDANFKYGTATITYNKEAAEQYAKSLVSE
jgi:glyoxylase-like metal-dependent hydrolase (beta-lactamase superfamily II)